VSESTNQRNSKSINSDRASHITPHTSPLVGLIILIIIYLALAISFSQVIPFDKGPDEGINLDYIEFIAVKGRLPVTYDERDQVGSKANWPALYHLIVAWISNVFDIDLESPPHIKIFWDTFRYRAMDFEADGVWFIPTEDQEWPFYGRILVLHIGRWFSILFSVITLLLVYLVILEILSHRLWFALAGTALLAFTPTFIFVGSVMNEDALIAALATLYFWILIRVVKQPEKLWPYWVMGLVIGLSITVKYTTVVLPFEVVAVLAVITWQRGYSWPWWLKRVAIFSGSLILASSWWFGWNFWFLNEVEELGLIPGLLRPLFTGGYDVTLARLGNFFSGGTIGLSDIPADTQIGTFSGWVKYTFLSFWGVSIGNVIPLSPYAYIVVGLIGVVAVFGLWRLWRTDTSSHCWLVLLMLHVGIFIIAPLVRFGLSRRIGQTAQGRHILVPAAAAIMVLLVWGLATVIPRRWHHLVFTTIVMIFIGWTGVHLYRLSAFAVPPLPLRTLPQAAEWLPHPINATFGDSVELVSYELDPQPARGLLGVNLAWRSLAHTNESYLLKVTLIDRAGKVVSHWLGYNGQGRLPTLSWDPGDSIFDRLALPLPDLPAGEYQVQLQLLSNAGPLAIGGTKEQESSSESQETILSLSEVSLSEPSALSLGQRINVVNPKGSSEEVAFDLWQANGPVALTQFPIYRYPATISVITSRHDLTLALLDPTDQVRPATHSEANIHTFVIGPRWPSGRYRLRMTLEQGGEVIGQATTGPLLTVENWWERHFEPPENIDVPMEANLANQLKFLGYTLPQNQVKAGEAFPITLYWQALLDKSPQADFIQFNHLLDSSGTLRGGYDRRPLEYYSTLLWAPGEVVIDGYAVPVDAGAPPGEYYLDVGYYLTVGESAVNLPLVVDGQRTQQTGVTIGPIEVISP
jgi:hypothetical protein